FFIFPCFGYLEKMSCGKKGMFYLAFSYMNNSFLTKIPCNSCTQYHDHKRDVKHTKGPAFGGEKFILPYVCEKVYSKPDQYHFKPPGFINSFSRYGCAIIIFNKCGSTH